MFGRRFLQQLLRTLPSVMAERSYFNFPSPLVVHKEVVDLFQRNRGQIAKSEIEGEYRNTIPSGITFDSLIRPVCSSNLYLFRLPRGVSTTTCCISEIPLLV